jgi:hypothetical protein
MNKKTKTSNPFDLPVKELVAHYLISVPELRDDRMLLLSFIWQDQAEILGITTLDGFIEAMALGDLLNAETIRRCARKLQAEHPELQASPKQQELNQELEKKIRKNKGEL